MKAHFAISADLLQAGDQEVLCGEKLKNAHPEFAIPLGSVLEGAPSTLVFCRGCIDKLLATRLYGLVSGEEIKPGTRRQP